MRKILFSMTMIFLLSMAALAQGKTDFSGNWELDTINSRMDERMRVEAITLKIDQTDKAITIGSFTKRAMPADGQTTDAKSSVVSQAATYSLVSGTVTRSSTEANADTTMRTATLETDGTLKLRMIRSYNTEAGKIEVKFDEVWALADGGETLKITRTTETPSGASTADLVFKKKAKIESTDAAVSNPNTVTTTKTISGGVLNGKATSLVKPAYPEAAKTVKAGGTVNVQVTIDEQGSVIAASVVSGHPLLRQASEEAARASTFSPTLLQGVPVKVTGIIVYNFTP